MKKTLTIIILTYNESCHIERVIQNVSDITSDIIVLDSYSTDDTCDKAKLLGAEVIWRKFDNYKNQREYAIEYCRDKTEWILFLDADEYLSEELKNELSYAIKNSKVDGYYIPRRFIFMNKWIKWGGYYPTYLLRLFRPQFAYVDGIVNEHIKVHGNIKYLKNDIVDHNLNNISYWIMKHDRYANLEAISLKTYKVDPKQHTVNYFPMYQDERKKWLRNNVWNRLPTIIVRPLVYFIYRYIIRLGFLDGKEGFIYHFLQAYWFWLIVDIKYNEIKNKGMS